MSTADILGLIGNTPLVALNRINPNPKVKILAKLEAANPGGSIKDRVALAMIKAAEASGELTKDKAIIEATSGNTGIGLSMVCAIKGYRLLLLMPETASEERKRIMLAYGAQIRLTPGHLSTDGAIEEAYRLAREEPDKYVLMDQFNNPASITAHYQGTAQEIWDQTQGQVTHVVAALGTSGTAMGLSKRLKELNPSVKVVAVEPYAGHKIQGLKNMQASYPPGIFNKQCLNQIIHVEDEEAFSLCRRLAKEEGIFAGMSSGAALAGALRLAGDLQQGEIVVIFPDGGERYLSTPLFQPTQKKGIWIYNLQGRKKQYLEVDKEASLFTPGPYPFQPQDLEVWRRIILLDVLASFLDHQKINAQVIVGVADLDDQALEVARAQKKDQKTFSREFIEQTLSLAAVLKISPKVKVIAASNHLTEMLKLCEDLLARGRAYEKLRSVYYDVRRDKDYGQLTGADLQKISLGKTVDLDNYAKDNPQDFTLLKRASLQNLKSGDFIQTKWGNVRPSWYLQMAAIPAAVLNRLDLVLSGRTHHFPHLENLRGIWKQATGLSPALWMEAQAVTDSKDETKVVTVKDLLEHLGYNPYPLRLWLLSISYRKPLSYSIQSLTMWQANWRRLQNLASLLHLRQGPEGTVRKEIGQTLFNLKSNFKQVLKDDLSLYKFWPTLFEQLKAINRELSKGTLTPCEARTIYSQFQEMDRILKIIDWDQMPLPERDWPAEIRQLIKKREKAKQEKEFAQADRLREEINQRGYQVKDSTLGPLLHHFAAQPP